MFFSNLDPTLEKLLIGVFFFAIYWFVLRRYNSLGLRMFVMFLLVAMAMAFWLYQDEQALQSLQDHGQTYQALVLEKQKTMAANTSSMDNSVKLSFQTTEGKTIEQSTSEYVSDGEYARFEVGKTIEVLYDPTSGVVYVGESLTRFKNDKWILYVAVAFFALIGAVIGWFTRGYKVGVHEDTGDEYLEKDGKIVLDERKSPLARTVKRVNIVSKLMQVFGKH